MHVSETFEFNNLFFYEVNFEISETGNLEFKIHVYTNKSFRPREKYFQSKNRDCSWQRMNMNIWMTLWVDGSHQGQVVSFDQQKHLPNYPVFLISLFGRCKPPYGLLSPFQWTPTPALVAQSMTLTCWSPMSIWPGTE